MLHTGVETEPREFYAAIKDSFGIALIGAIIPFSVSMCVALALGYDIIASTFVGLTMTATALMLKACASFLKNHPSHWSY